MKKTRHCLQLRVPNQASFAKKKKQKVNINKYLFDASLILKQGAASLSLRHWERFDSKRCQIPVCVNEDKIKNTETLPKTSNVAGVEMRSE